ncbi:tRNA glutamyl-Q(34) synthetase GluQRS [Lichenifustis flavocetrariae]|uniref:tRNA glutamyl-Q(34) synthetase GluQRS n=1 Tax=Lichenifustis flavocetrariae TaxID=2949735 RepID=A0AA41YZ84_9HYPH|nr:tRNA glutamyl-Q(34) synthetase GluQRS [Lichenifustis flavocetrariae]MCW6509952.1 tRNA glutamyl-Q(34) synthetase GluQRS [Lichenifustis flavocetrariae]
MLSTCMASPDPMPIGGAQAPLFRFAPSPNGFLHLGHAYSALMNDRLARERGGMLLLRFEDIDRARCRPDYEEAALADLAWLGVAWTPPPTRQSDRFPLYRAALQRLEAEGLVYPCFCTRGDIAKAIDGKPGWPRDPDGSPLYPGTCRRRTPAERDNLAAQGAPAGLRLDLARALDRLPPGLDWVEYREGGAPMGIPAEPARWGDALLARKDIPTSYHVSVVVDDAAQGVTDVVRGEDLLAATGLHRVLQVLLGLPAPVYHHHRLICDASGEKLAKSRAAPTLRARRATGESASDLRRALGFDPTW